MVNSKIHLYNPTYNERPDPAAFFQPKQIADIRSKSIIILDNAWWIWEQALPALTEALSKKYGVARTTVYKYPRVGPPSEGLQKAIDEGDCAIVGLALGGPEIAGVLDNAIALAKAGLPTVCIVVEQDPNLLIWQKMAQSRKVNLPIVTVPVEPEGLPVEKVVEMMEAIIDDIVTALKNPPKPQIMDSMQSFIEVPDSLNEIHDIMYGSGWTDGLPIIPPTKERVRQMLAHVQRDADEVIGEMPPLRGTATVGNIAVNAVMAGCLPEHMPVVIAQAQACVEMTTAITIFQTGAEAMAPMTIINGPVRNELDINYRRGLMGPGRQSNASIGRALQLMLRNIGGATTRITMPGYPGNPACYSFCFGENEEETPWDPLQVERGFSRQTNTITVTNISSFIQNATYTYDWKTMLTVLADSVAYIGCPAVLRGEGTVWIFITPEQAKRLSDHGLSKKDAKEFIWERARVPVSSIPKDLVSYPHKLTEVNGRALVAKTPDDVKIVVIASPDRYYALCMVGLPDLPVLKTVSTIALA